jgi:putative transposase
LPPKARTEGPPKIAEEPINQSRKGIDEHGHRLVVGNGHAPARSITTGVGQVEVVRPRVDDRRVDPASGQRVQFASGLLPRWCRRSPKVAEVLPLRYLHGLSSLDFVPALEAFFGASAGLSASVVTRLTSQWQAERAAFARRSLADRDYVYCWADGIHCNLRLADGRQCCLVIVGVRADGTKELVAVADGQRESADAWAELLRDCRRRGMGAPAVMVGDGALGLWAALREVFPATREQRCWVHSVPRGRAIRGGGGEVRGVIACVRKLASASRWESGPGSCQEAR